MNVGELLRLLRDDILHDQSDQMPGATYSDYLWSDQTLITYMNEAQRRFATESLCLRDATTPDITRLSMVAFRREYPLHPSVIAVLSVRCEGDRVDLARAGHSSFDSYFEPDRYFFNPSTLSEIPPGKVVAFDTDEGVLEDATGSLQVVNLRLYPPPDTNHVQNIRLRVVRKPRREFTLDQLDMRPEIPDDHHIEMLSWAAKLAFEKADRDAEDLARADRHEAAFNRSTKRARDLLMRKEFTPMQWGFGRNGFSWEGN